MSLLQQLDPQTLIDRMQQHVGIISLSISYPRLSHVIDGADVGLQETGDVLISIPNEIRTSPQWKLISPDWAKRFQRFYQDSRKIFQRYSRGFPGARGTAILPWARMQETLELLQQQRVRLCGDPLTGEQGMMHEFIDDWPGHVNNLRTQLHADVFAKAVARLPNGDQLRNKFGVRVCAIPLAGSRGGIDTTQAQEWLTHLEHLKEYENNEGLQQLSAMMRQSVNKAAEMAPVDAVEACSLIQEAQAQLRDYVAETVEAMAYEPRKRLADALENLSGACRTSSRNVRGGTIAQVQEAFEYLQSFSFLADREVLDRMQEVSTKLNDVTPKSLNSDGAMAARFAEIIDGVSAICRDDTRAEACLNTFATLDLT